MPRLAICPLPKRYLFLAVAVLLTTASLVLFIKSRAAYLTVEIPGTGEAAWAAPLSGDEQFQLRYIHSVDLLPVFETYTTEGTQLVLVETRFLSWGAGLGYMQEGILSGENGWTVIKEMKRQVGTIPLRVGTIAEHTLLYRGMEIRLRDYLPAQSLVHIRVKNYFSKILREVKT
jgi:hypothetical protein